jgi:hypothetical protein
MKGDFSRWTAPNAEHRHYKGVLMQQGRPQTDADWNEQVTTGLARTETALTDVVGPTGTPKGDGGFAITPGAGGFNIAVGRYYLGGALVRNDADTTYAAQGGAGVAIDPLPQSGEVLVYLEAWEQHVTALDDTRLADPALGSIDTATRVRAGWRVGVDPVDLNAAQRDALIQSVACGAPPALPGWGPSTGTMYARTLPAGNLPDDSDCEIPPEAGYLSQENQLYRVQIIRGGTRGQSRFVWSRENGSVQAVLARNSDGDFILQGARDDEALGFKTGDWVELYDDADTYNQRSGNLHRITISGDTVTFAPAISNFNTLVNPKLRRWDHGGNSALGLQLPINPTELERGIEVSFTNGTYTEGDYWVFEARAATGNIVWPQYPMADPTQPVPPMGRPTRRAALALATISGQTLSNITDLRAEFPPLTCLQAEDVGFDDTLCQMDAETVQDALEVLCQRTSAGLCNIVVANAQQLIAAVASIPAGQSARICLRAGQFALPQTLQITNLAHVTLVGAGPQTMVSTAHGESAFAFSNCASVRVTDMSVNGGPTGFTGRLMTESRLGAVTTIECGDQSFERLRLRCRSGRDRQAACISTRNAKRAARMLVRDCDLSVGQSQIGIQIIGARRAIVEDNQIAPTPLAGNLVHTRIANDPALVARIRKSLIQFSPRPGQGNQIRIHSETGQPGAFIPVSALYSSKTSTTYTGSNSTATVTAQVFLPLSKMLIRGLGLNRAMRISTAQELRQHLTNAVCEAIRDPGGRATFGPRTIRLLTLGITRDSYLAQGIAIAGDNVQEAQVTGNRIDGALDGIRIAASSRSDPNPPNWRMATPPNIVQRARITGNVIGVAPLAETVEAHGIYLGHVENVSVGENVISGPGGVIGDPDRPAPHFGLYQYGYRGARMTVTENSASALWHGYVVAPSISDNVTGIWRLRDNSARGCNRPYVLASGVQVF